MLLALVVSRFSIEQFGLLDRLADAREGVLGLLLGASIMSLYDDLIKYVEKKRRRAELLSGERRRKIPVFIEKRGMEEKEEKKELFCFMHKAAKACFYKFMQKRE